MRQRGGILKFLREEAWIVFNESMDIIDDSIVSIHCFVASNKHTIYRNTYELKDKSGRAATTTHAYSYTLENQENEAVAIFNEENAVFYESKAHNIRSIMDLATNTVIRYVEAMLNVKVITLAIDYVIDSKSQLWMMWTSEAKVVQGNQLADIDIRGVVSGDRAGRMSWAGPKYFEAELELQGRGGSANSQISPPRLGSSSKRLTEGSFELREPKADALTTASQISTATTKIEDAKSGTARSKRRVNEALPSPRNIFSAADNSRQQQSFSTDPFKCKGDYCDVVLKQVGSLSSDNGREVHIYDKFFTKREIEVLRRDKRFSQMMVYGAVNGPALAAIANSSIILARKERRDFETHKEDETDWKHYPLTPRQLQGSVVLRNNLEADSLESINGTNGDRKQTESLYITAERKAEMVCV